MRRSPLTTFARALSFVAVSALGGCSSPAKENTPATPDAGPASDNQSTQQPSTTGSNCTAVTQNYTICADVSLCPGVEISPYTFPNCGYSVHGNAIDPECLCSGSMCPMGAPATCDDMQAILMATNIEAVCAALSAGHCTNLGSLGTPSSCQQCKTNCDGNVMCLQNCGC
jgi:hypothetical protein